MLKENIDYLNKLSDRIIYSSDNVNRYVWVLILNKIICCGCIFLVYDYVKKVSVIQFTWFITALCSLFFGVSHRTFETKKPLKLGTRMKLLKYSLIQIIMIVLFFNGLLQVGPYRTSLLTEHSDLAILAVLSAVLKGKGGPGKLRGSLLFILAILSLLLFDNDSIHELDHPEGQNHHGFKHLIFYVISWMGLSDHEGGILILLLVTLLSTSLKCQSQYLSVEVGGSKRLNCIAWNISFLILSPVVFTLWILNVLPFVELFSAFFHAFIVAMFYFVSNFYITFTCIHRLTSARAGRVGTLTMVISALFISVLWTNINSEGQAPSYYHRLSGGSIFSLVMFCIATMQLTSTKNFISIDMNGDGLLPFHNITSDGIQKAYPVFTFISSTFHTVLSKKNSRTIFYFLCFNLGFTFVELIYGMWTNSLGLISDGFHMLFDCSALVMGLCASVMALWKPTKQFPFGYGRIEVLSGFVNGLFLSVIGFMVFIEAIERLFEPPQIDTERLLTVAICGLIVNLCGILAFSLNSNDHCHGDTNSYFHEHSHSGQGSNHNHNANMEGVFLHILADTLGSVAVIVSSILIDWYGWLIADPICSLILSVLILTSVFPLLKNSTAVLLLSVPIGTHETSKVVINKILEVESVLGCQSPHLWQHCDNLNIATITVQVTGSISEQKIRQQIITILQGFGFAQITVQVDVVKSLANIQKVQPSVWELGSIHKAIPTKQDENYHSIREI